MKSEKNVKDAVFRLCKKIESEDPSFYYERRIAQGLGYKKGLPDLFVVKNGKHAEVELKREDGRLSPLQEYWKTRFEAMGIPFAVVRSADEFQAFVDSLEKD